jgi:F-type H+-transporting ATPase subunit a
LNLAGLYTGILGEFNPLEPILSKPVFSFNIGSWPIVFTNHMFMVTVATLLLIILIPLATRKRAMVPHGLQNLVESICVYFREEVARPILHEHTDQYIPFIWTVFLFILSLNLLAMVPSEKVITMITGKPNHFGGAATSNIWITGAMAVVTFFMTHISGIRTQGLGRYLVNLAPPVPWWLMPIIYFLEIVSSFVKPFALAIRLFANMVAGHMVLATFLGLIFVFKLYSVAAVTELSVVALSILELLVAFVQAYIFALLSTLYIGSSIVPEH